MELTCFLNLNSRWAMRFCALRICVALAFSGGDEGGDDIVDMCR